MPKGSRGSAHVCIHAAAYHADGCIVLNAVVIEFDENLI